MNRILKFAVIAFLVVLVCWRFGGFRALAHDSWLGWGGSSEWSSNGGSSGSGRIVTRDFTWGGNDRLELDIPAHVRFQTAPAWHLSIRGREGTLDRIVVSDGRISEGEHGFSFFGWHHSRPVQVELSGPALREASLNGSGSIELKDIDQDRLQVQIRGNGKASGSGKVGSLRLEIMGSGSARLEQLAETNADVTIEGSGDADVSPSGEARVTIAGSGDVRLHGHPAQVSTHIYGSGHVSEMPGNAAAGTAPQPAGSADYF